MMEECKKIVESFHHYFLSYILLKNDCIDVGTYYDLNTYMYLDVVETVIQSHRTTNESVMLNYYLHSMGAKNGIKMLDAGCGVCGPAIYFATQFDLKIDCVTNSHVQLQISRENIEKNGLLDKVKVFKGDYHFLDRDFCNNTYDVVYFLESYGHAFDNKKVLKAAAKILKNDGILYIKDYFIRDVANMRIINRISRNMNRVYRYNLPDLYHTIHILRNLDFEIIKIGSIDFETDKGRKAVEFEKNMKIDLIGKYKKYGTIPYADPLELILRKRTAT